MFVADPALRVGMLLVWHRFIRCLNPLPTAQIFLFEPDFAMNDELCLVVD